MHQKKRSCRYIIAVLLAITYGVCLVWGNDIMNDDKIHYADKETWLRILGWSILMFFCINTFYYIIPKWVKRRKQRIFNISDRRFFLTVWIFILIIWLPVYLACWPGLAIYDGPVQLVNISTHHPFLHTLFIRACNSVAKSWGGRENGWVVPYAVIQMGCLSAAFTYLLLCLKRWKFNRSYIYIILAWIVCFPMNPLMAVTTTKDTLFTASFLPFLCELGKIVYDKKAFLDDRWNCIKFVVICFMLCALRNNGVYVLVITALFMVIRLKTYGRKIPVLCFIVILGYLLYSGPFMNVLHIPQGDKREALTIIIQPLARTYYYDKEYLSEEEKEEICALFGQNEPYYQSHISDGPKSQFDSNLFFTNFVKYIRLYVKLGIRLPNVYMDAILANTYGNWYPHEILPDTSAYRFYFEFPEENAEEYGSFIPGIYNYLQNLTRNSSYLKIPFLYIFFCTGIVFWIIAFLFGQIIIEREYDKILFFIPFGALFLTIMLGPVALFRYTYPLLTGLSILFGVVYDKELRMGQEA